MPRRREPEAGHDEDQRPRPPPETTVIKVLAGAESFELTRGEINRHEDSLLHGLLQAVEVEDDEAPVELDLSTTLNNTLFSTFTQATAITVALYRHERLPVQLLSEAAKSHNTRALLEKMQQLLDFLAIPGPVSRYLPAKDNIRLQHLAVLDVHMEAAAQEAVDLMLGSSVFSCSASTGSNGAAFFLVRLKEEVASHYDLAVYALSGGELSKWPKGHYGEASADYAAGTQVLAVRLPAEGADGDKGGSSDGTGGSGSSGVCLKAAELIAAPREHGAGVSEKVHKVLCQRISAALSMALAQVPFRGSTGQGLQSRTFTAYWSKDIVPHKATCVWAVWW